MRTASWVRPLLAFSLVAGALDLAWAPPTPTGSIGKFIRENTQMSPSACIKFPDLTTQCTASSGGGGGSSSLAVTTGSVSGFTGPPISTPTAVIVFDTNTFAGQLTGSATYFSQISQSFNQVETFKSSVTFNSQILVKSTASFVADPAATYLIFAGTNTAGTVGTVAILSVSTQGVVQVGTGNQIAYRQTAPLYPSDFECNSSDPANCVYITHSNGTAIQGVGTSNNPTANFSNNTAGASASALKASKLGAAGQAADFETDTATAAFFNSTSGTSARFISGSGNAIQVDKGNVQLNNLAGTSTNVCADGNKNLTTAGCNNGTVTSVTGTAPIISGGGATPAISLSQTIGQVETFTSSVTVTGPGGITDTFGVKAATAQFTSLGTNTNICTDGSSSLTTTACNNGTVTSVTGTAPIISGGGATPAISLSQTIGQVETFTSSVTITAPLGLSVTFGISGSTLSLVNSTTPNTLTLSSASTGVNLVSVSSAIPIAPADFLLTLASPTIASPTIFGVQLNGHIVSSGTVPTLGSCGTSPSIDANSTDLAGTITAGTGSPSSCALVFVSAYLNTPVCVIADNSTTVTADISSVSTTGFTVSLSAGLSSVKIYYICIGAKG